MSTVKVGPKGQIVIPKEAREMFGIEPGDSLLLLADIKRGIAMNKMNYFTKMAEAIFSRSPSDENYSEDELTFANAVREEKDNDGSESR